MYRLMLVTVKQDPREEKEQPTSTSITPSTITVSIQTTAYPDIDTLVAVRPHELTSEVRQRPETEGDEGDEPNLRGSDELTDESRIQKGALLYGESATVNEAETPMMMITTTTRRPRRRVGDRKNIRHRGKKKRNE